MNRLRFPLQKPILVISDYPTAHEVANDMPWSSAGNLENLSYIRQAGINYNVISETYLTYTRPDDDSLDDQISKKETLIHKNKIEKNQKNYFLTDSLYNEYLSLEAEIKATNPQIIICFGKWSLFFLTNEIPFEKTIGTKKDKRPFGAIATYRASYLSGCFTKSVVFPLYPSAAMHRDPGKIFQIQADFNKIGVLWELIQTKSLDYVLEDNNEYVIGSSIDIIKTFLSPYMEKLKKGEVVKVSIDIETRGYTIDCIGISFNSICGLCIPLSLIDDPEPWTFEEELEIFLYLQVFLRFPNLHIIGQNFGYDSAYFYKFFAINLIAKTDTMITHHTLYNSVPKSLDFLASIYCEKYKYWKNEREK